MNIKHTLRGIDNVIHGYIYMHTYIQRDNVIYRYIYIEREKDKEREIKDTVSKKIFLGSVFIFDSNFFLYLFLFFLNFCCPKQKSKYYKYNM